MRQGARETNTKRFSQGPLYLDLDSIRRYKTGGSGMRFLPDLETPSLKTGVGGTKLVNSNLYIFTSTYTSCSDTIQ